MGEECWLWLFPFFIGVFRGEVEDGARDEFGRVHPGTLRARSRIEFEKSGCPILAGQWCHWELSLPTVSPTLMIVMELATASRSNGGKEDCQEKNGQKRWQRWKEGVHITELGASPSASAERGVQGTLCCKGLTKWIGA